MTKPIEIMSISEFKATCLAVLERVRKSGAGQPLTVTLSRQILIHDSVRHPTLSETGQG